MELRVWLEMAKRFLQQVNFLKLFNSFNLTSLYDPLSFSTLVALALLCFHLSSEGKLISTARFVTYYFFPSCRIGSCPCSYIGKFCYIVAIASVSGIAQILIKSWRNRGNLSYKVHSYKILGDSLSMGYHMARNVSMQIGA